MLVERRDLATIKEESRRTKPNIPKGSKGNQPKHPTKGRHQTRKVIASYIARRHSQARRTATARTREKKKKQQLSISFHFIQGES